MWKKGKTKIIHNSIVTYTHTRIHTMHTHTHTQTLSPEYYAMSISLAPYPHYRHALCALSTLSRESYTAKERRRPLQRAE